MMSQPAHLIMHGPTEIGTQIQKTSLQRTLFKVLNMLLNLQEEDNLDITAKFNIWMYPLLRGVAVPLVVLAKFVHVWFFLKIMHTGFHRKQLETVRH